MGQTVLAGLAPALFLGGWAIAGLLAGQLMDAHARRPGIAVAFIGGTAVCGLLWFATAREIVVLFLGGIALIGIASGWLNLGARAGAADFVPGRPRARRRSSVVRTTFQRRRLRSIGTRRTVARGFGDRARRTVRI
ncbi:MAG: hypothetical protein M3454_18385 [Actinomycetota bacterium]|nr:hypothetical protein [Actinomycetota bacterium]